MSMALLILGWFALRYVFSKLSPSSMAQVHHKAGCPGILKYLLVFLCTTMETHHEAISWWSGAFSIGKWSSIRYSQLMWLSLVFSSMQPKLDIYRQKTASSTNHKHKGTQSEFRSKSIIETSLAFNVTQTVLKVPDATMATSRISLLVDWEGAIENTDLGCSRKYFYPSCSINRKIYKEPHLVKYSNPSCISLLLSEKTSYCISFLSLVNRNLHSNNSSANG